MLLIMHYHKIKGVQIVWSRKRIKLRILFKKFCSSNNIFVQEYLSLFSTKCLTKDYRKLSEHPWNVGYWHSMLEIRMQHLGWTQCFYDYQIKSVMCNVEYSPITLNDGLTLSWHKKIEFKRKHSLWCFVFSVLLWYLQQSYI